MVSSLKEINFLTLWQLCIGITIILVHFTEELQELSKFTSGQTYHRNCVKHREPKVSKLPASQNCFSPWITKRKAG